MSSKIKAGTVTALIVFLIFDLIIYGVFFDPMVFIGILVLIALGIIGFVTIGVIWTLYDVLYDYFKRRNEQKGT